MTDLATSIGPVCLTIPPEASLLRVARLAASALASLANCSIDEIEDIRIAVSETMIVLIEQGEGGPVDLEFNAQPNSFTIVGRTSAENFDPDHPDLDLCSVVLSEVCTDLQITFKNNLAEIHATVSRSSPDLNG